MDQDLAIKIESLSKRYKLGAGPGAQYATFRDSLMQMLANVGGLVRPKRPASADAPESASEFWALRDLSLEIKRGENVAIVGRNGAGKSTLLKILSRITAPTTGRVSIRGRVASLLEVGTGFHPELTGRENIFLNGAILGMTRADIQKRFDAIVAFSGIERFLDTPVKRYSSGMYVRLAFSVAAHVEPEVLVVDEVLAVGDAEFQRKCIGQMKDVSRGGRTVLFVSHNMAAVQSLTTRAIVLDRGQVAFSGPTEQAVDHYMRLMPSSDALQRDWGKGAHTRILRARLCDASGNTVHMYQLGTALCVEIDFHTDGIPGLSIELLLLDCTGVRIGLSSLHHFHGQSLPTTPGTYRVRVDLAPLLLAAGSYSFDISTAIINTNWDHYVSAAIAFEVPFSSPTGRSWDFRQDEGFGAFALIAQNPLVFQALEPELEKVSNA